MLGYHDIERIALQYVLEDEIWPNFVEWVGKYAKTPEAKYWAFDPDPGLDELRRQYILHHAPMISVSNPEAKDLRILSEEAEDQWPGL